MTDTLLDLDTLIGRPTIKIDGARYEILSPDELSVLDNRRFSRWQRQLEEMQAGDEDDPELDDLVATMARKVLVGVPADVFDKLSGTHRIAVIEVFTGLLLRARLGVAEASAKAIGNLPTGAIFSRGSSGSTAARRGSGWKTRLWRWFGLS